MPKIMIMRLVKLSEKNKTAMLSIAYACFGKNYTKKEVKKWYENRLDGSYKKAKEDVLEYYIVLYGRKAVGITGLFNLNQNKREFWLGYFGVIPSERKKGLGSLILEKTIEMAKKSGAKRFSLWGSGKRAEKFYKKNGFRKVKGMKAIVENGKVTYRFPKALTSTVRKSNTVC